MKVIRNITYWAATVAAIAVIMITAMLTPIGLRASAETGEETEDIVAEYEETNVWDNLKGSTIAGNAFNPADYPHAEKDKPRILSFVEFCYSLYSDNQDDYGLYVYLYNPQDLVIDTETTRNQIQLRCGKGNYEKYGLIFLNYSKEAGYEGRFWKFKVNLTETQKYNILKNLDQNGRVYEISGITLSVKKEATEHACGQKYTYSGYVKGYGPELAEGDTLTCGVDNFEQYLELDVKQTCYRPIGDYYNGTQAQLNSCYFRVPEKYFVSYGELTEIWCEWWEYVTKPILVTETSYMYNKLYDLHGSSVKNFDPSMRFLIMALAFADAESWFNKKAYLAAYASNQEEWKDSYVTWHGLESNRFPNADEFFNDPRFVIENFEAVFFANGSYMDRYVTSEELREELLKNSEILGETDIRERYSSALFTDSVVKGHTRGYNRKKIPKGQKQEVFWNKTTKDTWQTIFGGYTLETKYDSVNAIGIVKAEDLKGTDTEIAARLFVNVADVDSIKKEFAKCKDERLVMFHYGVSEYTSYHCAESYFAASTNKVDEKLVDDSFQQIRAKNCTAYIAQETVYLDFDIISLWFTADDGAKTEIPVVMSPQDVISGLDPPLDINFHNGKSKLVLALILTILVIIVLVAVLYYTGLLLAVTKGIVWIICLPFNVIAALVKKVKSGREKKRREKAAKAGATANGINGGAKAQRIKITEYDYADGSKRTNVVKQIPKRGTKTVSGNSKKATVQGKAKKRTVKQPGSKKQSPSKTKAQATTKKGRGRKR